MKENYEETVKEYVDHEFVHELNFYKTKIEENISKGLSFKKSFENIEKDLKSSLDSIVYDRHFLYLKEKLKDIEKDYGIDKLNNAIYSEAFQKELESKIYNLDDFIFYHLQYLDEEEILKFHYQNKAVFERYFKIKYDDKLKNKVNYDDLELVRDKRENDGITIDECTRLDKILNPQKKKMHSYRLQKRGLKLSTKDIAVFMILFKDYYKIKFNSYVEFTELSRLFFDDLHFNMEASDAKLGTSIKRYIKGEDLFAGDFNFDTSKNKVFDILTGIDLKGFKKYIEKVEINKFKKLIK